MNVNSSGGTISLTAPSSVSLASSSGPASVGVVGSIVILSGGTQSYITTGNSTTASPAYTLTNTNATATSCPIISTLNQGHNQTGTATDYLYRQQHIGKNTAGTQITFGGIDCISRNVAAANEDGVLAFNCAVNGVSTKVLEMNGNESEINAFQALDMNGQAIKTASGNMAITATASSGTGTITLAPKDAVAGSGTGLVLTGNTFLNVSAGASAGTHLCLTINGVVYKIALLNA
jgi:hypothetical protein